MAGVTTMPEAAELFKVLSSETRLRILELLRDGALCVGALSARVDVTQGAVSQHLRILRSAGLVVPEKRGCFVHYRLNEEALAGLKRTVDALAGASHKKGARQCVRRKRAARSRKS
jgi:DNA-binding transcriptional ArsR family regulator